jgi:hypothetical protein
MKTINWGEGKDLISRFIILSNSNIHSRNSMNYKQDELRDINKAYYTQTGLEEF